MWAALLSVLPVTAQNKGPGLEELPRRVIDTLDTERGAKVIIYTNNTWSYYYPDELERMDKEVYRDHWTNGTLFVYTDIQLKDIPSVTELSLMEGQGGFHAPAVGNVLSRYGTRGGRRHQGVDLPLAQGEPIYAVFDGKVRYARWNNGGYGNLVIIRHENGLETWYAHMVRCNVKENDYVTAGTVIGFCGSTGRSNGSHLHFEVRYCDQAFDPEYIIDFSTGELRSQTFVLDKSFLSPYSRASENFADNNYEQSLTVQTDGTVAGNTASVQTTIQADDDATDPLYHTIRKGEYLGKIARQYGTTVKRLCQLNNISDKDIIRAGQKLRVR